MTENQSDERNPEEVRARIAAVRENMERIKREYGIDHDVLLLAATKTVPADIINFAVTECGITDIGENRVNELLDKYDDLLRDKMRIHFIGKLQPNKVKYIVGKVCLIHSLDSMKLAQEIEKRSAALGITTNVLIEINIGREESKSGIMPEETENFARAVSELPHVKVCGIMTMAPICERKDDYLNFFEETYRIFIDISAKKLHNIDMRILSVGMSDSYEYAMRCGSNLVRLGSALFGKRNYPEKDRTRNT